MNEPRILVINPGSTSTKLALFQGATSGWETSLDHPAPRQAGSSIMDQYPQRLRLIRDCLEKRGVDPASLAAVVGRGGLLQPVPGGTYRVNSAMLQELREARRGEHASNLGAVLAQEIAGEAGIPAYIVDPVVVDEMESLARLTGMPELERHSIFHALNQKAVARQAARALGRDYEEVSLVVAHLGGGVSVGAHCRGRVVDVNNALDGDGPFSPERSGGLPAGGLMRLCFGGEYNSEDLYQKLVGCGGLVAYLGTHDGREVEKRMDQGDREAERVYRGLAYQVCKEIGAAAAVLYGQIQAVVLTGGLAHSRRLVGWIEERVAFLGPVLVYPGEEEMEALALGGLRVLWGQEEARAYPPVHGGW